MTLRYQTQAQLQVPALERPFVNLDVLCFRAPGPDAATLAATIRADLPLLAGDVPEPVRRKARGGSRLHFKYDAWFRGDARNSAVEMGKWLGGTQATGTPERGFRSQRDLIRALYPMSLRGEALYHSLFGLSEEGVKTRKFSIQDFDESEAEAFGRYLQRCLEELPICVENTGILLSWNLMNPKADVEQGLPRFWALRADVEILVPGTGTHGSLTAKSPRGFALIDRSSGSSWGLTGIRSGIGVHDRQDHPLKRAPNIQFLARFMDVPRIFDPQAQIVYYYGHSERPDENSYGAICVDSTWYDAIALQGGLNRFQGGPVPPGQLVFINGCSSVLGMDVDRGVPNLFVNRAKGKVYVVGTWAEVPPEPAAKFGQVFFEELLFGQNESTGARRTLGESMAKARAAMLADHHPIAICYGAFGRLDISLAPNAPRPVPSWAEFNSAPDEGRSWLSRIVRVVAGWLWRRGGRG